MASLVMQMSGAVTADALGVLFVASGVTKASDVARFASDIAAYRLIPVGAAFSAARFLIAAQLVMGLWLCSGWSAALSCVLSSLLLLFFALAMGINIARGRTALSCGCMPGSDARLSWDAVRRNVVLALLVLGCAFIARPAGLFLTTDALLAGASLMVIALASSHLRRREFPA